ncbi:hypothetical protein H4I96_00512 [Botrytis cinerea]
MDGWIDRQSVITYSLRSYSCISKSICLSQILRSASKHQQIPSLRIPSTPQKHIKCSTSITLGVGRDPDRHRQEPHPHQVYICNVSAQEQSSCMREMGIVAVETSNHQISTNTINAEETRQDEGGENRRVDRPMKVFRTRRFLCSGRTSMRNQIDTSHTCVLSYR